MKKISKIILAVFIFGLMGFPSVVVQAITVSDSFNRINETPIAGNWTTANSFTNLSSNQIIGNGLDDWMYWNSGAFGSDQFSQAKITTTTTEDNHAVAVRIALAPAKTFYFCDAGAVHEIGKFVGGSHTSLKSVSVSINANDTVRCEVQGTTIRYIVNGTTVDSATDSSIVSGSPGFFLSTSNGTFDDWSGGDLSSAPDTTAPSVPANPSASAVSSSAINLSWTASSDNVGVTGYKIYRGGVQIGTSASNSYSDTGLTASTQYTYTVSAYDAAGNNSSQSSSASATTQSSAPSDTTAPSVPTNLSATAISSSAINLSWTASSDNVGVTGYKIYRGGSQIGTSATNSYSDTGLTASTQYTYTVSAYDAAGNNSSQSTSAGATTQATQAGTGNVACSGDITTSLQAAIDASVDGDVINIGAGSCTASQVGWTNKNIIVKGQGIGVTNVTGLAFDVVDTTKALFRITGMSVGPATSWKVNAVDRKTGIKGWRIDHVSWTYPTCGQNIAIWVDGINWGLMDHNQFMNAGNAIFRRAWADNTDEVNPWPPSGNPGMGGYSWLLPLNLGTDEALYIENNSFVMDVGCYDGIGDSFYGGRSVFRYNTVVNAYWQNHAARGFERGGNLKAEIYNNDFNATDSNWSRAVHIRSGTGVVFNNSLRGYFNTMNVDNQRSDGQNIDTPFGPCNGTSAWDGNTSGQSGWPCLDQIGRGPGQYPNQPSAPLYVWNNGSSLGCSNGGSCANDITMTSDGDPHVLSGRDYINNGTTAKPGYTPFTYPYPLTAAGLPDNSGSIIPPSDTTPPAPPTGVSVN